MKPTLFKYIFKMQMKTVFLVSLFFFGLIVVFDFAEASRRTPISTWNDFLLIMQISFFGALSTFAEIMHYLYFITATFSLWYLCNSRQITILKSSGQSPLQILYPFVSCAMTIAGLWLFAMHPAGLWGNHECQRLRYKSVDEYNENIWIDYTKDNKLIFLKRLDGNRASDIYIFDTQNSSKIIADGAVMNNEDIDLNNGVEIADGSAKSFKNRRYNNKMNSKLIEIVSISPQKQSIYKLHSVYEIEKQNGVTLTKYEIALQQLLVNCFTFVLFAIIAAVICFPINRYNSKTNIVVKTIAIAVVMRFLNNIFEAMANSGVLSPFIASWIVVLVAMCISVAMLIWREV